MIPHRHPGQSHEDHQTEVAAWLGTDIATMNRNHDPLHLALCAWLGIESQAMRHGLGQHLGPQEHALAALEEEAVLHVQRLIYYAAKEPT